jgi:nitrite reductase/ring-hydroxylating ferredoxin subunit
MAMWQAIGDANMLGEGAMTGVEIADQKALLVRIQGEYRAYRAKCPHMGSDLSKGTLEDGVIVCSWHGSRFDALTGKEQEWAPDLPGIVVSLSKIVKPPKALTSYPVKEEDGQVWIDAEAVEASS